MSYEKCLVNLKLSGLVNGKEIQDAAEAYVERGQSKEQALISAVQWKITELEQDRAKVVATVRKAYGKAVPAETAKEAPPAKPGGSVNPLLDAEKDLWGRIVDGTATIDEFKVGFENWVSRKDEIVESLMKNTKDTLLKMRGFSYDRYKNEPKAELVDAMWRDGVTRYVLARSFSHGMGKNSWLDGVRNMVENTDADQMAQYAEEVKAQQEEALARVGKIAEAIKDPKTLDDYRTWLRANMTGGKPFKEARMMLTPEQRAQYDAMAGEETRSKRKDAKEAKQESVMRAPGETLTASEIIKTKHTKQGHDLWQFELGQRVSSDEFKSLVSKAKILGGTYSSYRGGGAIPGWQFKNEGAAKAFRSLITGSTTEAKELMQANRDAYADDRSQSAAERLTEMADRLEEQSDASLNQDRKTNTNKRASQAASAESAANSDKAMAKTMRNIATAISDGTARFLDRVRQKTQVAMLQGFVKTAKDVELRAKYESYGEQERHKGEPPTGETADYAEFPYFTAYRSDLATLARQLLDVDGTKLLGQRLLKEADDVSDAYLKFSKENLGKVSIFRAKEGGLAGFSTKGAAEDSIARSGYKGKAIAYQVKRGEYTVIASPAEAVERGIWNGDGDKRITLTPEIGNELVEKIGKAARRGAKVSVPWQLETAHDRQKALSRMGIETPAEFRAALREFIGLQEQAAAPNKVKELERSMVGRKNDGMDFFPTPESVADEMVSTADIQPGMAVLEPSAGWGHIAERIRAAGVDPDVGEMSNDRRELLEAKGFNVVGQDFLEMSPRGFTFGDTFRAKDGTEGVMRGLGGLGSNRVRLVKDGDESTASYHNREDLTGIKKNGSSSGYDRILMNPPFSDGRDIQHVQHAYTLLKPGGRIVAIMGESAFTNQNKRATEFREWLESVGGTEEKLAEGSFNDPSLPVNTGANARMVVIDKTDQGVAMFSRASPDVSDPQTGVSVALLELGKNPDLYQYPKSDSKDIETIAQSKGLKVSDVDRDSSDSKIWLIANTAPEDTDTTKSWLVELPPSKPSAEPRYAILTNDDGKVYINVSSVGEGNRGSAVYDLAANYAANNGLTFIGDPLGVSPAAMRRRLENMLSAAVKYGTTDFMEPHADQLEGNSDIGVPALNWTKGDTLANIRSMVDASVASTESTNPVASSNVHFDAATQSFRDGENNVIDAAGLEKDLSGLLGFDGRTRGTGQAGNSTLRRNAIFRALLSGVGARRALVDALHSQRDQPGASLGEGARRAFYSRGERANTGLTPAQFTTELSKAFGEKAAERLQAQGIVVPIADKSKIPGHVVSLMRDGDRVHGFYDPGTNRTYAVLENLTPDMVRGVVLHEVGVHFGFEGLLGIEKYTQVMKRLDVMRRGGNKVVQAAYQSAKQNAAHESQVQEETLAYLVQNEPAMGLVKEIIAKIKAFLYEKFGIGGDSLNEADLTMLARAAVLHATRTGDGKGLAPAFSRTQIVGQTNRQHTPEQLRAMTNVGFQVEVPTLKERAQALWKDAGKKMAQGIVDQFAPVKSLDKQAYGLLRLAKGASGAFEAFLRGGRLKLTDGVYDFDDANKGGVVDKLLIPLQGEHHDFFRWVAANRAERLTAEGKENLFSPQDIADLKTLADGTADFDYTIQNGTRSGQVTRDRTLIYADSLKTFNEFNTNILDLAEQSGLIDGESRKLWEHEFYVPFYRVADEESGGVRGMNIKGSVVRQEAFKTLKGGKNALNADLLDNTLMNWAHLLDASAKNRAAKATIEAAERMGAATTGNQSTLAKMGASIHNKHGVVWFMDQGQKRFSLVDDPYLMTAITSLEYAGMRNPVMNAMGAMKHALTVGVTASPFFKVRNLIRDSVQVIGTSGINANAAANIKEGWKLTDPKSDAYFRLLAGGGTIHFGTMLEGSEAKRVQALVESGVDDATILNSEHKVKAFYRKFIEPGITAYNELGNRGEAINRAALYDQLRKQGMNHADASLQARDLMDFSMQGSFATIRFLTQVVPFFNARIQGLYKLGRAAKEDPARFGAVVGAAALASIGLLAAFGDDDDWRKREEWDRNNFWWFKFGGMAFRIPKPFEIGAIATLAERGFELAFDKEMTGERFRKQVLTLLGDNLSMNPVPQLVKPIMDVYANKDSFSGRPIETMGMDKLKSDYRFTDRTSMTARAASTGLNAMTGLVGAEALSPVQVDHMLRGYFGWLGAFVVGAGDIIARPATGQNEHPSSDMWKVATGGMASDLRDAPSRYVSQMYTQAKELEQAYGTWRALQKEGKTLEAQEFAQDNRDKLAKYRGVEAVKRAEAKFNERIRLIERSNMDADAKRDLIRTIQVQKDRVARAVM